VAERLKKTPEFSHVTLNYLYGRDESTSLTALVKLAGADLWIRRMETFPDRQSSS
jgi:hypothetical protein